ncbi:hypothetical protein [Nostoc sp.]|uniref:hypothetical protein n=1 Tax=Nostoc sp. TaxID=1180 RepID=UPI002FF603BD
MGKNLTTEQPNNEFVTLPKDLYVLNTLAMGVAIQLLAKMTGESIEDWKQYVGAKAGEQYRELSTERIQEIVESLDKERTA